MWHTCTCCKSRQSAIQMYIKGFLVYFRSVLRMDMETLQQYERENNIRFILGYVNCPFVVTKTTVAFIVHYTPGDMTDLWPTSVDFSDRWWNQDIMYYIMCTIALFVELLHSLWGRMCTFLFIHNLTEWELDIDLWKKILDSG